MKDQSAPNTWPYWIPNMFLDGQPTARPSQRDPWDQATPSGMEIPTGGLLAKLAQLGETETSRGPLANLAQQSVMATPFGANVGVPATPAPNNNVWETLRRYPQIPVNWKPPTLPSPSSLSFASPPVPTPPPMQGPNSLYNSTAMPDPAPQEPAKDFPTRLREALSDANVRYYLGPGFYEAYQKLVSLTKILPGSGSVQATQDASRADDEARAGNYGRAAAHLGFGTANAALDWIPPAKVLAILGGGLATTFPRKMLPKAFDMEATGRSAEEIWQATGLGRSADGRWIFEMPDSGYRIDPAAGKLIHWPYRVAPLYQQLVHPGVREAYPEPSSLKSYLHIDPSAQPSGLAGPRRVLVRAPDLRTAESIGMHELQHEIAFIEGGPRAYPPQYFMGPGVSAKEAFDLYWRQAAEVEARNAQRRLHMSDRQRRLQSPQSTERPSRDKQIHIFDMP
jgi:Large polyvalent protein associated domain 23